ncbi:MAG: acetyl-CoA carboxylase biotin carboxyl carrier protein [Clostridiales bacterium]|nr:acetyl-CoA carboxylase biotin carboxyl carrier protein [bacterium 210917-SL.2.15]MCI5843515.1 acetyl-CoA carboxylase biotin carboxyl carrier protein [Clostridiales bacterium]MDY4037791.1 acetyl-CoA carboxylase biotin carboxyl carrier protein [Candidatus Pseudoscilispira sp.]
MELKTLFQLMDRFSRSDLSTLEWHQGEDAVVLKREMTAAVPATVPAVQTLVPSPSAASAEDDAELVTAPMVGTYYAASSPDEAPFVTVGQKVSKGDVLCIIEAMKMMSEITAQYDGVVVEILAENGQAVGFGAPLLRLRRA